MQAETLEIHASKDNTNTCKQRQCDVHASKDKYTQAKTIKLRRVIQLNTKYLQTYISSKTDSLQIPARNTSLMHKISPCKNTCKPSQSKFSYIFTLVPVFA